MTNLSKIRTLLFASLSLVCFSVDQAQANLIVNGSFETPVIGTPPANHVTQYNAPSTGITGWTVTLNSVDRVDEFAPPTTFYWDAQDGSYSLDLNGSALLSPGAISQVFSSLASTTYELTYYYSRNPYSAYVGGFPRMEVKVNGSAIAPVVTHSTPGTSPSNMNWTMATHYFNGTGSPMTLTFESLTSGSAGIALDNVSLVVAVPEPASMALLGFGAVGLAIGAFRRRRTV